MQRQKVSTETIHCKYFLQNCLYEFYHRVHQISACKSDVRETHLVCLSCDIQQMVHSSKQHTLKLKGSKMYFLVHFLLSWDLRG